MLSTEQPVHPDRSGGAPSAYAHSVEGRPVHDWEPLERHLEEVAALAESFAAAFGCGAWGQLAGLWHDIGKYQPTFQDYIQGRTPAGPPHAWTGALLAAASSKEMLPLAFAIAGHHAGLADLKADATIISNSGTTPLTNVIADYRAAYTHLHRQLPSFVTGVQLPSLPSFALTAPKETFAMTLELFTRFLFGALIDADRTATSRFYARFLPALTHDDLQADDIPTLRQRLDAAIDAMSPKGSPAVIQLRRTVLEACRARSVEGRGRFSLTVPTGGGKTLSAMSFALRHAQRHGLRRVIVVIPYTSIIEQSARVYKEILGAGNVLEHHSNLDEQKLSEKDSRAEQLRKLAAENWASPVVVTTTVQFFESFLSAHPSRCRKLHNIANSVILLDEVQTLPPQFLRTIIDVLAQLTDHYGCSAVLSTATPPALVERETSKRAALRGVREIMASPSELSELVRRVKIDWRVEEPTPYEALAQELRDLPRVLAIVHRRDDARKLAELIGDGVLHLSAAMCPAHRLSVIAQVRDRLAAGQSCRLVATQLVEAGVDLDFPVVYRSLAGLDSIAQSAGRCDREGKLTDAAGGKPAGRMVVFRAETDPPPGVPRKALDSMQVMLGLGQVDPFEPKDSIRYFDELYGKIDDDEKRIEPLRKDFMFAAVAERFKLIDADTHPIVVPWGEGADRLAAYFATPCRATQRALQPFIVQVRRYTLDKLRSDGVVSPADEYQRFDVVNPGWEKSYDERFGLNLKGDTPSDAMII